MHRVRFGGLCKNSLGVCVQAKFIVQIKPRNRSSYERRTMRTFPKRDELPFWGFYRMLQIQLSLIMQP